MRSVAMPMSMSIVLLALVFGPARAAEPAKPVPWSEVRAALGETICMTSQQYDGKEYLAEQFDRKVCSPVAEPSPLQRAVDKALESASHAHLGLALDLDAARAAGLAPAERTKRTREAFLASDAFLGPVLRRLPAALEAEGLACVDCPAPQAIARRRVPWAEFSRYVAAYVWPDPVRTPVGKDGKPTGEMPRYAFHVCSGLNGVKELKDADPVLLHAAFVGTFGNRKFLDIAGHAFEKALDSAELQAAADDAARTAVLRKIVPAAAIENAGAKAAICAGLEPYVDDVGVELADCATP